MNINELQEFLITLEDIATYCNLSIDEKFFSESIRNIKKMFNAAKIDIPPELKLTKRSYDYRSQLQKFGGYKERRERIKETFYPLIDYLESKIDISNQTEVFSQKN